MVFRGVFMSPFLIVHRLLRGFLFVPTVMALSGVALAIGAVWIDRAWNVSPFVELLGFLDINAEGARSVLSTIAGAMITVISLVYTLTLVVFTLAAGTVGPRLIEHFSNNWVNQATIGLLGATFLYALIVLYIVGPDEVPVIATAVAILLAAVSFFWVVFFVHDVASRIMVDNEIGRIQRALRHAVELLISRSGDIEKPADRSAVPDDAYREVTANRAGYVTVVDVQKLIKQASQADGFIELLVYPGSFVVPELPVARLYNGAHECDEDDVRATIQVADRRTPEGDILFNVHLLVEIALRALSPGINDSYTAVSAIDHLSGALAILMQRGAPTALYEDDDGTPRVWLEIIEVRDIVGIALNPLRRAARENMLVTLRLIDAIARVRKVAHPVRKRILDRHLMRIVDDAQDCLHNPHDRREVSEAIRRARTA